MKRILLLVMFLLAPCTAFVTGGAFVSSGLLSSAVTEEDETARLYRSMQLEGVVNWKAFRQAVEGYGKIRGRKRDVLTLIDFSKPSTE